MYRLLKVLKRDEKAATAVEYGLIVAMIVIAIMGAINTVASRTSSMWNRVANEVTRN